MSFSQRTFFVSTCLPLLLLISACSRQDDELGETTTDAEPIPAERVAQEDVSALAETSNADQRHESDVNRQAITLDAFPEPAGENETFSIAQVMQWAHDNKLYRELYHVPVDAAVGERITILYESLKHQVPPKGDPDDWQQRVAALATAAEAIIGGDESKIPALKKAVNCNSCHNRHRS